MISPARIAAFDILSALSSGAADLPTAIAHGRGSIRDDRDRALAAEIASGVQRWRAALDHVIETFAKRPLDRLDQEIVDILRLSAYQLLHLSRVPAAAVVDDAVDLAKRSGKKSAAGFVNAVLRTVSRRRGSLPLPPKPDSADDREAALDYLSITLSHPRWLAARWLTRYGLDAAAARMAFNNQPAHLTLRANRVKCSRDELAARLAAGDIGVRPGAYAPDALIVEAGYPLRSAAAADGSFVVQDEASQLVGLAASELAARHRVDTVSAARPTPLVLDACASPGGKTTAIAAAVPGGLVIACDVRDRRIQLLRRTVHDAGASNVRVVQANLRHTPPFSPSFDVVLVDAPCSGLGTLRRDPDIRWRRREDDLPALAAVELALLRSAATAVAPGGRLLYATCSSEPDENGDVAAAFLAAAPEFKGISLSEAAPALPLAVLDEHGRLETDPMRHGLEAFFAAAFERAGPAPDRR
jgi:16S rRNA (cytosine967-C5)-methyltransferase